LIGAVDQAQRHCMGFDANARSTRVTSNSDGSRTVSFECERMQVRIETRPDEQQAHQTLPLPSRVTDRRAPDATYITDGDRRRRVRR
jgi:hypothetical protein